MAASPASMIEKAAKCLLKELEGKESIQYGPKFYNGSDDTHNWLAAAIGLSESDDGWYSAEALIDLAAAQLELMGIVSVTLLEIKMSDGEPDYRIAWTPEGPQRIASGEPLVFVDME